MKEFSRIGFFRALLISISFGMASSPTLAETKTIAVAPSDPASELTPELLEIGRWFDQVVLQLANSETPWIRVAAAIELSKSNYPGKSNDPERVAVGVS